MQFCIIGQHFDDFITISKPSQRFCRTIPKILKTGPFDSIDSAVTISSVSKVVQNLLKLLMMTV